MKKLIALLLILVLAFSFAACGEDEKKVQSDNQDVSNPATDDDGTGLVILDESLAPEEYGIGFRKEDTALCYAVEAALVQLKEDGTMAQSSEKWFGEDKSIFDSDADVANVDVATLPNPFKLGLDDAFPPMGYQNDQGEIIGFDIDLAQAVCDYYGIQLECVPVIWDTKDIELTAGNIDCIWNGLTITEDRLEGYCMSKPYLSNRQVVVVAANSGINTLNDLAGKRVALQSDSSASEALEANEEVNASIADKVELTENLSALLELQAGSVDAVVMDEVVARYVLSNEL